MTNQLKVAAVQFEPTMFRKHDNIDALLRLVGQAAREGARLITTPEMATTGYCWVDRAEVSPYVEPVPGPTTTRFVELAKQYSCYVVLGMPEVDPATGLYYNSAVLIGPEGVLGCHRKTHPYISEPKWAAPGNLGHQVFDTPIGRVGLLICMDIHFIETARLLGVAGTDIICHISNWLAERTPAPYWISRAAENDCYLIESNRWGLERGVQFSGGSCVIGRDGSILASVDSGDGIAYAELEPVDRARSQTTVPPQPSSPTVAAPFGRRRPDKYPELMTNPFTWNSLDYFRLYNIAPLPPGRRSRVATAQFNPSGSLADNLAQIARHVECVMNAEHPSLIVFPELSLTGSPSQGAQAEPIPGPATDALVRLAMQYGVYLVAGIAEQAQQRRFNGVVLAGPEGLVGTYRKLHLDDDDLAWATPGENWRTFDTPLGRLGILTGYDALFPESCRVLALAGCDLIACPGALKNRLSSGHPGSAVRQNFPIPTAADPCHWHHFRVRAGENNVYLAFSNRHDAQHGYVGQSGVFGPDTFEFPRRESLVFDAEGYAVLDIDTTNLDTVYPTNVARRKDLLMMRLPHHYTALVESAVRAQAASAR
ncbi:nitrilase-related carbon-nitrogen hydrolase [Paraburkholderia silvatlantica]|uniref:Putative amidohydrolase n=1 Tax=Paraburkholderia silvatlantica TaxID=321895 RepID=A0A2V4U5N1_9BURK|nr:nitrilase-related carbon-nitrogen hydrolase [Paraburkholderia silvatlantica]PYE17286.1 putative amidohydrolase [Paraburkholderia silvatlantica]TDQ81112.1 putative amidohydrolase [Paraburkholderia silvatlantica]